MSTVEATLHAGASMRRRRDMANATPEHKDRARRSLRRHTTRTMRQLIAAGSCWRAVQELVQEGEVRSIGSTPSAALVYALACEQEA